MIKKISLVLLVIVMLIVGFAFAAPFLFKDKINALIKKEINAQLRADVDYESFDLSIVRSFPNLSFSVNDLLIVNRAPFVGDTLAQCNALVLGLDLMSVVTGGKVEINRIELDQPKLRLLSKYAADGSSISSNFDIFPTNDDGEVENQSNAISFEIEKVRIGDAAIYYDDIPDNVFLLASHLNIDGNAGYNSNNTKFNTTLDADTIYFLSGTSTTKLGGVSGDLNGFLGSVKSDWQGEIWAENFDLIDGTSHLMSNDTYLSASGELNNADLQNSSNMQFSKLHYVDGNTSYLSEADLGIQLNIDGDLQNNEFVLSESEILLNQLALFLNGKIGLPGDGVAIDVDYSTSEATFASLLSLLPSNVINDISDVQTSGLFSIDGNVKGKINETQTPAINAQIDIKDGSLQYTDVANKLSDINLQATVNSPANNMEALSVVIPSANMQLDNEPIAMRLDAQEVMGDPLIDFSLQGKVDLKKVQEFYPMEDVQELSGEVDTDISFKGRVSAVNEERYEEIDLSGDLMASNVVYASADIPNQVEVKTMQLDFSPSYASLSNLDATIGESDIQANGKVENVLNYLFNDGDLNGTIQLTSNYMNLNEFLTEGEDESEETEMVKMPDNIDLAFQADIKELLYDNVTLNNLKGGLALKDEALHVDNLAAKLLGGSAVINGKYDTKDVEQPKVDFAYKINQFSIQETFTYLNSVRQLAPLAKFMTGTFSSEMDINTLMNPDLSVDMSVMEGLGSIQIPYATFSDLPMIEKSLQVVNLPGLNANSKPSINNAFTVIEFEDGKVNLAPFDIKAGDINMNIAGSNGLDQSIEYVIKIAVPSDKFGGAASKANDFLSNANIPLLNLAIPQQLVFHLNVTGDIASPKIAIAKVTASESDKGIKEALADKAKEEAQALLDKAKEEADKAKQDALDKAKEAADKAKQDALDKAKEEADKVKENLKENIKDKLNGFGFGK